MAILTTQSSISTKAQLYCNFFGHVSNGNSKIASINFLFKDSVLQTAISLKLPTSQAKSYCQLSFICKKQDQSETSPNILVLKIEHIQTFILKVETAETDNNTGVSTKKERTVTVDRFSAIQADQKYRLLITSNKDLDINAKLMQLFVGPTDLSTDPIQQRKELLDYLFITLVPPMQMMLFLIQPEQFDLMNMDQTVAILRDGNDKDGRELVEKAINIIQDDKLKSLYQLLKFYQKAAIESFEKEKTQLMTQLHQECFLALTEMGMENIFAQFAAKVTGGLITDPEVQEYTKSVKKAFFKTK